MSTTLKKITTKAKALYKTGKFPKWTDAIKAASATISKTTKKAVKKVGNVTLKKANYHKNDERYIIMNDGEPHLEGKAFFKNDALFVADALRKVKKKRKAASKKVGYSEDRMNDMKEITRLSKNYHGMTKQGKTDRAAAFYYNRKKEGRLGATKTGTKKHTDTKSHNTNITVVSGINKTKLELAEELKTTLRDLANSQAMYKMLKERYKTTPKEWKVEVKYAIHQQKGRIAYLKNNLTRLKALIK